MSGGRPPVVRAPQATDSRGDPVDVTVLLFAAHRDLAGADRTVVSLPDRATVAAVLAELRGRGGGWAALPERAAVAVNRRYAHMETELAEGDDVALIPPVAGG